MTKERIIIVVLLILLLWFGAAIVRLENYHYAVQVGFCDGVYGIGKYWERDQCLSKIKTRTNFFWHLLYGLQIIK